MRSQNLVVRLLAVHLKQEVDNIISIINQGFDLHIYTEFPEVASTLKFLLQEELVGHTSKFRIINELYELDGDFLTEQNFEINFIPAVMVNNQKLPIGSGFAKYVLDSPDKILGKTAAAVQTILSYYNLENYLDCFDGKIFTQLKQIAKSNGIYALIDAVIQTAFLSGVNGKSSDAFYYLNNLQKSFQEENQNNALSQSYCAKKFLAHCISYGDEAMDFLKSCLCYYVVDHQGRSMTQASQILDISRTTLNGYLALSKKLDVSRFFDS